MTLALLILGIAVALCVALAALVFFTNRRRIVNQHYLLFALVVTGWLSSVGGAMWSSSAAEAAGWLRWAFVFSSSIPSAVLLLRHAIVLRDAGWRDTLRRAAAPIALNILILPLFYTTFFLREVRWTGATGGAPFAVFYGPGFPLFSAYFLVYTALLIAGCVRDVIRLRGIRRAELGYVLLGAASGLLVGATLSIVLPLLRGDTGTSMYAPTSAILLNACIAFGIVSRRILDVTDEIRRVFALLLLSLYLLLLYFGVWGSARWILLQLVPHPGILPQAVATLAVAFAMAPAHGQMQRLARRLFHQVDRAGMTNLLHEAGRSLHAVTTLDALPGRFSALVVRAIDAESLDILLRDRDAFVGAAAGGDAPALRLAAGDPIPQLLGRQGGPVLLDALDRGRPEPLSDRAAARLRELDRRMAVGVRGKDGLRGILLLGSRVSGSIYDHQEQQAIQALCDQLALALENARLYTEVETGRRYNETLLDRLPSGVIATDADGTLTVLNREARRMIGLAAAALGDAVDVLPGVLREALAAVLASGKPLSDRELHLVRPDGDGRPIRAGAAPVPAPSGGRPGALLVFEDLSRIRDLERRIQQKEGMAKIGMLAASLAHEIKNPLFTLKTFAHLLPAEYGDRDFRENFAPLVGREVRRIDSIVNDLLRLARLEPGEPPPMRPVRLHELLDATLDVVRRRIGDAPIEVRRAWNAARDTISGNADLLEKTFDHFYSNSIEAMPRGLIYVTTENVSQEWGEADLWGRRPERPAIRILFHDTGPGIPPADRPFVFEPFFTRKAGGTGLGLAVAHRNVAAHGGSLTIEDREGFGAVLAVVLPLAPEAGP